MKLVTNVTPLLTPLTGIGHYTHQLLAQLWYSDRFTDIQGLAGPRWYEKGDLEKFVVGSSPETGSSGIEIKAGGCKARLRSITRELPYARQLNRMMAEWSASRHSKKIQDYIYWEPNYTLLPLNNPSVVTIHDLSHLHYPHFHPQGRVEGLKKNLEKSIQQAHRIVAVSEYTRKDIIANFPVDADMIDIVSPGVDDIFRRVISADQKAALRKKYQLPEQFILSVATLEPRKNIEGLIRAYGELSPAIKKYNPLVLVGAKGWLDNDLERRLSAPVARGEVIRLGYISQNDMPGIYSAATCLAYVSFFEGFGMPIAEAMATGTAVLTSNTSSMPEVAANSAILVNPIDTQDITQGLEQLVTDHDMRETLALSAKKISQKYTWKNSAELLLNTLAKVNAEL